MRDVWGLADTTRRQRGRVVGEFLLAHFGDQPITMSTISAASVRRFVLGKQGRSAGTIGVIGGAIGCYLRFRTMSGDRISELATAIPRAAHWRLASLPEVLSDAEIDELLRSFDQPFRSHRRAYRDGCGASPISACDAAKSPIFGSKISTGTTATIRLGGTKTRRVDILPLPDATGCRDRCLSA